MCTCCCWLRVCLVPVTNRNVMGRTRSWASFQHLVRNRDGTHSFPTTEYSAEIRNRARPPNRRNYKEPVVLSLSSPATLSSPSLCAAAPSSRPSLSGAPPLPRLAPPSPVLSLSLVPLPTLICATTRSAPPPAHSSLSVDLQHKKGRRWSARKKRSTCGRRAAAWLLLQRGYNSGRGYSSGSGATTAATVFLLVHASAIQFYCPAEREMERILRWHSWLLSD